MPTTARVGAPPKFKKVQFYICKSTLFIFHQFYSARIYLKGYAEYSKTTFSPTGGNKTSQKTKNRGKKIR